MFRRIDCFFKISSSLNRPATCPPAICAPRSGCPARRTTGLPGVGRTRSVWRIAGGFGGAESHVVGVGC